MIQRESMWDKKYSNDNGIRYVNECNKTLHEKRKKVAMKENLTKWLKNTEA
jgi:hypothetical protein